MKISVLFSIFFMLATSMVFSQKEKLMWDEDVLLTWKDFKGTPEPSQNYIASTHSGMYLSLDTKTINGKTTYITKVVSYFYPNLSWYRPGNVSAYILKHEQTHFDISELHARKLRKELAALDQNDPDFKDKVSLLYTQIEQERVLFQAEFDLETEHSNFPDFEREWEQKVADLLTSLDDWK